MYTPLCENVARFAVALDDVSVTEWRSRSCEKSTSASSVALDDVSVTEWRHHHLEGFRLVIALHSMTSVLLNGGIKVGAIVEALICCTR